MLCERGGSIYRHERFLRSVCAGQRNIDGERKWRVSRQHRAECMSPRARLAVWRSPVASPHRTGTTFWLERWAAALFAWLNECAGECLCVGEREMGFVDSFLGEVAQAGKEMVVA